MSCRSIGILLEGDGDAEAVPVLLRKIIELRQYFDMQIGARPIAVGDYIGMMKAEKFLRFFRYAIFRDDLDGVIIALDCDDHCALEVVTTTYNRIRDLAIKANKPVGIILFVREYETMFLVNLAHIASRSAIQIDPDAVSQIGNPMALRDAKGYLSSAIKGGTYKPTRDQARITGSMDIQQCAQNYRPLQHFINVVDWVYNWDGTRHLY